MSQPVRLNRAKVIESLPEPAVEPRLQSRLFAPSLGRILRPPPNADRRHRSKDRHVGDLCELLAACLQLIQRRQQLCRAFRFFGRTYMYLELRPHRIDQRLQEHADALQVRITDGQTDYPVKQQSAGSFLPRYHIYGCDRGWTRRRTTVASDTIAFGSDLIRSDGTSPTVRNRPQSDTAVT